MKLKSIFCGVAAAALLSACSSDEPVVNGGGAVDANKTTGYMSVAINLPTQPASSRANDYFSDGLPSEYAVKSSYLILFTGTAGDEANATFHSVYDLKNLGDEAWGGGNQGGADGTPDGNITVSYRNTVEVKGVEGTAHLFGLVMLNANDVCSYTAPTATTAAGFAIGTNALVKDNTKFSDIQKYMTDKSFVSTANGFFMTNAPLSTVPGGSVAPTGGKENTLVEIGLASEHLFATAAEAEKAPAASFFVERAVGKVTVDKSSTASVGFGKDGITNITGEIIGWVLDNTKNGSYVVRNLGENFATYKGYAAAGVTVNPYRFVGHSKIGQTAIQPYTDLYRTYWAEVPQNTDGEFGKLNTVYNGPENAATEITTWGTTGNDHPQYCHENTFTVDNMVYRNTTRAILKVKFQSNNEGADGLYIANGVMYDKLANALSHIRTALLTPVKNAILANIDKDNSDGFSTEITTKNLDTYVDIEYITNVNGRYEIKIEGDVPCVTFKSVPGIVYLTTPTIAKSTIEQINANYGVTNYVDGIAYYAVSIKHFGDDLTPWASDGNQTTTGEAYPGEDAAKNYLGRYGIVRNNWYDLQVTSFKKLGEPVVGNLPLDNTSDDNNEVLKYLSFRINILAWAKRSQNVEL